jgi:hypothetical protein
MKKMIFLLVACSFLLAPVSFANNDHNTTTRATSTKKIIDVACFQKISGDREDAVLAAFNMRNQTVATLLATRKTAIVASFAKSTNKERVAALVTAYKTFLTDKNQANTIYKKAVRASWQTFRTARKSCSGVGVVTELFNHSNNDLSL